MKSYFLPFVLMTAVATDLASGGGGSATQPEAKPAGDEAAKPAEENPAPKVVEPSVFQQVLGAVKGKGTLVAEAQDLRTQLEASEQRVATLTAENTRLQGLVSGYETDMAALATAMNGTQQALQEEKGKTKEVDRAAAEKITQHGFNGAVLPDATKGGGDTVEALVERLSTTIDPRERFKICGQIEKLEEAESAA